MKLTDVTPGRVVYFWHQEYAGSRGRSTIIYATVRKVGRVLVQVEDEFGNVRWVRPHKIDGQSTAKTIAEATA